MIVILDPAVLRIESGTDAVSEADEAALTRAIDDIVRLCRGLGATIPGVDWYWRRLQREFVRPLHQRARGPRLRQGLDALGQQARALCPRRPRAERSGRGGCDRSSAGTTCTPSGTGS
jgi:hypothetical protein